MKKIEKLFTSIEKEEIAKLVAEVEKSTQAEVVPMVVNSSTPVGHVPLIITFILLFPMVWIFNYLFFHDSWGPLREVIFLGLSFVISYSLGGWFGKSHFLQRWLTNNQDEVLQVERRALLEFYQYQEKQAKNKNLALIFFSLMERRMMVLTSQELNVHFNNEELSRIVIEFKNVASQNGFHKAVLAAISQLGHLLRVKVPNSGIKNNPVSDHVIIKN